MTEEVTASLSSLGVRDLHLVRSKLEEIAEMAEGFAPMSRVWTRRLNVDAVRMSVQIAGCSFEFEIDRARRTVNVVSVSGSEPDTAAVTPGRS
jgi:hypothetical protein